MTPTVIISGIILWLLIGFVFFMLWHVNKPLGRNFTREDKIDLFWDVISGPLGIIAFLFYAIYRNITDRKHG